MSGGGAEAPERRCGNTGGLESEGPPDLGAETDLGQLDGAPRQWRFTEWSFSNHAVAPRERPSVSNLREWQPRGPERLGGRRPVVVQRERPLLPHLQTAVSGGEVELPGGAAQCLHVELGPAADL